MNSINKSKNNFFLWILGIFAILFLTSFSLIYIYLERKLISENIFNNITEISEQSTLGLNITISNQKKFLEIIIESIQSGFFKNVEEILKTYAKDLNSYQFHKLMILDESGNGKTSDGQIIKNDPGILEFFQTKDVYLSEDHSSSLLENQENIYSKTFTLNGKKYVLLATTYTKKYKEIIERQKFHKEGRTYLINKEGTILMDSSETVTENNTNFFEYIKSQNGLKEPKELEKIDYMSSSILKKEIGTFNIKFSNATYFIHYQPVENNWYVVTVAKDTTISKNLSLFLRLSLGLCVFVNFIIIGVAIIIYRMHLKQNKKLYKIAYVDTITDLPNETFLKEHAIEFLQNISKNKYIMTLDINKFKAFNKIYDYDFCNEILKSLGEKLIETLPKNSLTVRLSNDVFAILVEYDLEIQKLLTKIFDSTSSLKVDDTVVPLSLSIGVYQIKPEETDINELLEKAYLARHQIKGLYDNNYFIFDEELETQVLEEQDIESSMKYALEHFEFKVFYQPKLSAKNTRTVGAEALVRWYRNGELISPDKFIPLFEKNKFIRKLDLYVFETVCKDINEWKEKYGTIPTISVNVSKEHFVDESFLDDYLSLMYQYGIDKKKIELEITESATSDANILSILKNIKKNGFKVSLDDFGTGYSSLNMLQNMPVDIIKIDKSFVSSANLKIEKNIINYIVMIAEQLGVKTVVEGVETKEQLEYVKKIGCDIIQGFYYSKPLEKKDFEEYLTKRKKSSKNNSK